jgi:AcrR family transcriptional regulator
VVTTSVYLQYPGPMAEAARSAPTQRQRREATRRKLIVAARELFIRDGYNTTTMAAIAERAGVAVQTVYFVFHTKGELLNSVYDAAVLGEVDPTAPDRTDWYSVATSARAGHDAVRAFVTGCAEILQRVAPLDSVVATAENAEPSVRRSHEHGEQLRAEGYRAFTASLSERGLLTRAQDLDESTDVLLAFLAPAMYLALTKGRGWSHTRFVDWTIPTLELLLLDPDVGGETRQ